MPAVWHEFVVAVGALYAVLSDQWYDGASAAVD